MQDSQQYRQRLFSLQFSQPFISPQVSAQMLPYLESNSIEIDLLNQGIGYRQSSATLNDIPPPQNEPINTQAKKHTQKRPQNSKKKEKIQNRKYQGALFQRQINQLNIIKKRDRRKEKNNDNKQIPKQIAKKIKESLRIIAQQILKRKLGFESQKQISFLKQRILKKLNQISGILYESGNHVQLIFNFSRCDYLFMKNFQKQLNLEKFSFLELTFKTLSSRNILQDYIEGHFERIKELSERLRKKLTDQFKLGQLDSSWNKIYILLIASYPSFVQELQKQSKNNEFKYIKYRYEEQFNKMEQSLKRKLNQPDTQQNPSRRSPKTKQIKKKQQKDIKQPKLKLKEQRLCNKINKEVRRLQNKREVSEVIKMAQIQAITYIMSDIYAKQSSKSYKNEKNPCFRNEFKEPNSEQIDDKKQKELGMFSNALQKMLQEQFWS